MWQLHQLLVDLEKYACYRNFARPHIFSFSWFQIAELADIARCVAKAKLAEGGGLEYLQSCMEDLEEVLQQSRAVALTAFTFGRRIRGLVR